MTQKVTSQIGNSITIRVLSLMVMLLALSPGLGSQSLATTYIKSFKFVPSDKTTDINKCFRVNTLDQGGTWWYCQCETTENSDEAITTIDVISESVSSYDLAYATAKYINYLQGCDDTYKNTVGYGYVEGSTNVYLVCYHKAGQKPILFDKDNPYINFVKASDNNIYFQNYNFAQKISWKEADVPTPYTNGRYCGPFRDNGENLYLYSCTESHWNGAKVEYNGEYKSFEPIAEAHTTTSEEKAGMSFNNVQDNIKQDGSYANIVEEASHTDGSTYNDHYKGYSGYNVGFNTTGQHAYIYSVWKQRDSFTAAGNTALTIFTAGTEVRKESASGSITSKNGLFVFESESEAKSANIDLTQATPPSNAIFYNGVPTGLEINFKNFGNSSEASKNYYLLFVQDISGGATGYGFSGYNINKWTWKTQYRRVVKFNSNDGSGSMSDIEVIGSKAIPATSDMYREGYVQMGWNTQADGKGTDYAFGSIVTADKENTSDLVLYAKWLYAPVYNATSKKGFETLDEAFEAADYEDILSITTDCSSQSGTIQKPLTLNLNGHKIQSLDVQHQTGKVNITAGTISGDINAGSTSKSYEGQLTLNGLKLVAPYMAAAITSP